ncbi:hypothetical protein, partial [Pseudomonas syringae]|uniref:hypothetical protein n=1 Tax=Pseudomonas syringae TaxID=317 RepID=UPI001F4C8814
MPAYLRCLTSIASIQRYGSEWMDFTSAAKQSTGRLKNPFWDMTSHWLPISANDASTLLRKRLLHAQNRILLLVLPHTIGSRTCRGEGRLFQQNEWLDALRSYEYLHKKTVSVWLLRSQRITTLLKRLPEKSAAGSISL